MSRSPRSDPDDSPDAELVRQQLTRILSSRAFSESQRMSRFLRLVVEKTLAGEGQTLKEYLIGVEVFDRSESYDPRIDPIVRVEARRLRSKLESYYRSEGQDAPVRIELPTGTYTPVFRTLRKPQAVSNQAEEGQQTIAVLPFTNLSPDGESEYLSDGLTEELTHLLTKVPGLLVVAWRSAQMFKGRQGDIAAATEQLAADVFVRGSVRRAGDRVRIMAQLVKAGSGIVLWSESYDRQFEDIFSVQAEIALAIANALQLRLRPAPEERPADPNTLAAYNLYLRGRYYWNTRSVENLHRSVQCFGEAIALDGRNALAHVGLADAYTVLVDYCAVPAETLRVAEAAARKAMELDPRLAEPYATLALIRSFYDWHWSESEILYRRSIELNPNYATAHHWYGIDFLAMLGHFDAAEREIALARRLDPLSSIIAEGAGYLRMLEGRLDDAVRFYEELLRRDPEFTRPSGSLGRLHMVKGDYDRAIRCFEEGLAKAPDTPTLLSALGQARAMTGDPDQARRALERLAELSELRPVSGTCFAIVYIGLGDFEKALDWLETAAARKDPPVVAAGVHPVYQPLRGHARFRRLITRLNLDGVEDRVESYRKTPQ